MGNETIFDALHRIQFAYGEAEVDLREKRDEMNMLQTRLLCESIHRDGPEVWRDIWDSKEWQQVYSEVGAAERRVNRLRADFDDVYRRLSAINQSTAHDKFTGAMISALEEISKQH